MHKQNAAALLFGATHQPVSGLEVCLVILESSVHSATHMQSKNITHRTSEQHLRTCPPPLS
eukprot:2069912-Prorocentrum_lima.AAC.1